MMSGHSHGGQFRFPGGYTPMHTDLGRAHPRGFYPDAPTPLYVSRGIGTTGPPSRFNCPPEVAILTLMPGC
jgi:predicted MPP superfamily phosphohydrolase